MDVYGLWWHNAVEPAKTTRTHSSPACLSECYAAEPGAVLLDSANACLVEEAAKKDGNTLDLLAFFLYCLMWSDPRDINQSQHLAALWVYILYSIVLI